MKSLRLFALLFILGCISMFVACNKEAASELPKVSAAEMVVEERAAADVVFEDVWAAAVTSQITPNNNNTPTFPIEYIGKNRPAGSVPQRSTFKTGMKWRVNSLASITFLPDDASGRLKDRIEQATGIGRPANNFTYNPNNYKTLGDNWQPHHIIPIGAANSTRPMVREAAKQGFHLNEYYNGVWLPNYIKGAIFHASNSAVYVKYVNDLMDRYSDTITRVVNNRTDSKGRSLPVNVAEKNIQQEYYNCLVAGVIPMLRTKLEALLLASQKVGGDARLKPSQFNWPTLGYDLKAYYKVIRK
jgi:A nuclease family of the HNH/ENDO VII superfamily with conserved AHH